MSLYQRQSRQQLHREITYCWQQGRIAVSNKNIRPETFLSEADQLATAHGTKIETKIMGGRCYVMANEGLPLGLDPKSPAGETYRRINPQYRINQSAWSRISEGLGL